MTTGRVVVVKEYREPFVIEEYEVPDPEPGGLVLKITQAGICGSDLHTWRGDQVNVPLPESGRVMGHEGTGVVYQLGKGTTTDSNGVPLHEGDRIMYSAIKPCGNCYQCMRGEPNWCPSSPYSDAGDWPYFTGTYADYYWIRANHPVFKVPDELPDSVLGWVNCAMGSGCVSAPTFSALNTTSRSPRACSGPAPTRATTWSSRARAASASTPPRWRRTWARIA